MVEILDLDLRAGGNGNKLPHMALLACKGLVLALERHSGFRGVIKAFPVQLDQGKFFAVMIGVATDAVSLSGGTLVLARVITRAGVQPALDLEMTLETLKGSIPRAGSEIVT